MPGRRQCAVRIARNDGVGECDGWMLGLVQLEKAVLDPDMLRLAPRLGGPHDLAKSFSSQVDTQPKTVSPFLYSVT